MKGPLRDARVVGACIAAVTAAVFWPMLRHGFLDLDDPQYITAVPAVKAGLTLRGVVWAFTHFHFGLWNPLTTISFMLDCQLHGLDPWGHHLTSLLLHSANALLLFLVLREMTGDLWESAFAACSFSLHPLRVESVAWASERKDVLSLFFWLLAMGAYVGCARRRSSRAPGAGEPSMRDNLLAGLRAEWAPVWLFFALGLMSKPMVVTFPAAMLLIDFWPLSRMKDESFGRLVAEKLPLAALAAAVGLVTILAQDPFISSTARFPLWLRLWSAPVFYIQYLRNIVWPADLSIYYSHPGFSLPAWKAAASILLLLGITAAALAARRERPYLWVGWTWFLLTLLPVIELIQITTRSIANRFTYIPQIGLSVALAWGGAELVRRRWASARIAGGAACAILSLLAVGTRRELRIWGNPRLLYERTLRAAPNNELIHNILGVYMAKQGDVAGAREQLSEAIRLRPRYADAYSNLGFLLARQGDFPGAIAQYREALRIDPSHPTARANLSALLRREEAGGKP